MQRQRQTGAAHQPTGRPARSLDDESPERIAAALRERIDQARHGRNLAMADGLIDRLLANGSVRVIVAQTGPDRRLEPRLAGARHGRPHYFHHIPFATLEVGPQALLDLIDSHDISSIELDGLSQPSLAESVPLIGAAIATASGHDGHGFAIAVLDTGVDLGHAFFAGRIIDEACFSANADCPNGQTRMFGAGAGASCSFDCEHGSYVAGIALGNDPAAGLAGVAPAASLISIQVFSDEDGEPRAYTSDVVAALEHVYDLRLFYDIAAVNMSFGGDTFNSHTACDSANPARKAAIDLLRSVGVASVASSGNDGFTDLVKAPACISSAISVGATSKLDVVSHFSNSADFLSLLAPGELIRTALAGGGYARASGTSMAAPHVAGAWAAIRSARPNGSVAEILFALQSTGQPIEDQRNTITTPRIDVMAAIVQLADGSDYPDDDPPAPGPAPTQAPIMLPSSSACGLVGLELLPLLLLARRRSPRSRG